MWLKSDSARFRLDLIPSVNGALLHGSGAAQFTRVWILKIMRESFISQARARYRLIRLGLLSPTRLQSLLPPATHTVNENNHPFYKKLTSPSLAIHMLLDLYSIWAFLMTMLKRRTSRRSVGQGWFTNPWRVCLNKLYNIKDMPLTPCSFWVIKPRILRSSHFDGPCLS